MIKLSPKAFKFKIVVMQLIDLQGNFVSNGKCLKMESNLLVQGLSLNPQWFSGARVMPGTQYQPETFARPNWNNFNTT